MGTIHPPMTDTTLSPLFGETTYPSLLREGTESRLSHSDSGPMSLTLVTALTSPIGATTNDPEEETLTLRSQNPFLASIIARQQTPSTRMGPTTSGTHLNRSTETSSVRNKSKHGSFDELTSRPEPTGNTEEAVRTWSTTSRPLEGRPSTSATPQTASSWPESTPTAIGNYSARTLAADAQIYGHEPRRSPNSSTNSSSPSHSDLTSASIERTTSSDFQYDWESVYPGFHPEDANWEDP